MSNDDTDEEEVSFEDMVNESSERFDLQGFYATLDEEHPLKEGIEAATRGDTAGVDDIIDDIDTPDECGCAELAEHMQNKREQNDE